MLILNNDVLSFLLGNDYINVQNQYDSHYNNWRKGIDIIIKIIKDRYPHYYGYEHTKEGKELFHYLNSEGKYYHQLYVVQLIRTKLVKENIVNLPNLIDDRISIIIKFESNVSDNVKRLICLKVFIAYNLGLLINKHRI
jgi:hypothetical protein